MFDYKAVDGDSLWKISQKFGVNFNALLNANPQIPNKNLIQPGETIHIPK